MNGDAETTDDDERVLSMIIKIDDKSRLNNNKPTSFIFNASLKSGPFFRPFPNIYVVETVKTPIF